MKPSDQTNSSIIEALLGDEDDEDLLKELGEPPKCAVPDEVLAQQKRNLLKSAIRRKEKWLGKEFQHEIDHTNHRGDRYIFGKFGRHSPAVVTLLWLNPQEGWKLAEGVSEAEEDGEDFKDVYHTRPRFLPLGSISRGTMQEEDLIPDFIAALGTVDPEKAESLDHERKELSYNDLGSFCWERLSSVLNSYAPPFTYFGPHQGDSSDYGVWVSQEAIDEALQNDEPGHIVAVRKGEPLPAGMQYVVVTNEDGTYVQLYSGISGQLIWKDEY